MWSYLDTRKHNTLAYITYIVITDYDCHFHDLCFMTTLTRKLENNLSMFNVSEVIIITVDATVISLMKFTGKAQPKVIILAIE